MRWVSRILSIAAAGAVFAIASSANAVTPLCSEGPGIDLTVTPCIAPDNDDRNSVEAAIAAATGVDASLLNLTLYGKSDDDNADDLFSFSPNTDPSVGTWTSFEVLDGTEISYVTLKASGDFKLFELPTASSFSTLGILTNGDQQPAISHLSFWTTSAVPEPGTWAMMLFGLGALGAAMRRRRGAEARIRFAV